MTVALTRRRSPAPTGDSRSTVASSERVTALDSAAARAGSGSRAVTVMICVEAGDITVRWAASSRAVTPSPSSAITGSSTVAVVATWM